MIPVGYAVYVPHVVEGGMEPAFLNPQQPELFHIMDLVSQSFIPLLQPLPVLCQVLRETVEIAMLPREPALPDINSESSVTYMAKAPAPLRFGICPPSPGYAVAYV